MVKSALTKIIVFLILTLISLGCLNYYLYKVRVVENVKYTDVRNNITDNSITKTKAESLTFDSLIQKKENPQFKESYLVNSSNENRDGQTIIQPIYKLTNNSILKATDIETGAIPMFYTDTNSPDLEDQKVIDLIITAVQQDSLTEIDIDISITNKVENIENVVKGIISTLNPSDIKINLGLPLKWSDNLDYSYLGSVSRFYESNASIEVLNNLCNLIRIHGYGYTSINSANSGPITKPEVTTDSIKYYIYKGINSNKIDLIINNTGYLWGNRSYADSYLYNYVLDTQQVVIVSNAEMNNYLSQNGFSILKNFENGENLGVIENNGNIKYVVYPSLTQLYTLRDIAKSYGLNGFIYKNF